MTSLDILLTLTFSIVMLFFMIFPAMKITEWINSKYQIPEKLYTPFMLFVDLFLALLIGVFLKFF